MHCRADAVNTGLEADIGLSTLGPAFLQVQVNYGPHNRAFSCWRGCSQRLIRPAAAYGLVAAYIILDHPELGLLGNKFFAAIDYILARRA
jgi:hypothetical protein